MLNVYKNRPPTEREKREVWAHLNVGLQYVLFARVYKAASGVNASESEVALVSIWVAIRHHPLWILCQRINTTNTPKSRMTHNLAPFNLMLLFQKNESYKSRSFDSFMD